MELKGVLTRICLQFLSRAQSKYLKLFALCLGTFFGFGPGPDFLPKSNYVICPRKVSKSLFIWQSQYNYFSYFSASSWNNFYTNFNANSYPWNRDSCFTCALRYTYTLFFRLWSNAINRILLVVLHSIVSRKQANKRSV